MKNLDSLQQKKTEILQRINAAVKEGNEETFAQAFTEFTDLLQEAVMAEARGLIQSNDQNILAGRGVRALTSEETKYYQMFIDAARSGNPKQALAGTDVVMPKTIIDSVMEDIVEEHPILDVIDFQNTAALTEIFISATSGVAVWGELTAEIAGELTATFSKVDLTKKKLTAFIPVAKSMLDLGPEWIDRYVRAILVEANSAGLEDAAVDGDGDDKMLGMTRALSGAVDGVYPRKAAVTITDLDPATFGTILNTLSQGPNGKRRAIKGIIMVVNPADYFTKVLPATTVRTTDGRYATDVFPFPTTVIQSSAMPVGYAVFGLPKKYFAGLGTSKGGRIEYDDSIKFFEDQRVYAIRLYGDGRPKDANAFVLADISGLIAYVQKVYVVNDESDEAISVSTADARLASLTIGALTLSPSFNKSVFVYTTATSNATNTITANPMDGEATVEILNGVTPVTNGTAATWAEGANVVTINVTSGAETETYTITVTYTAG
jgi:HK97 family phage major capsid protein